MNLIQRLLFALFIIFLIGGVVKILGINKLDVCDNEDLINNMTESKWTIEGGAQSITFLENGRFVLFRGYTNDGVRKYNGNYRLLECKESSKVADSRDVELIFLTDGELIDEIGNSIKIYFTSENYDIIHLGNVSYYKVSKYENLTKGD
jgi:hypothetical protein